MQLFVTIAQMVLTLISMAIVGVATGTAAETVSTGTAFRVSPYGHLLTNYHVIKGCPSAVVYIPPDIFTDTHSAITGTVLKWFFGAEEIAVVAEPARIVKTDPHNDLALLLPARDEKRREGMAKPWEKRSSSPQNTSVSFYTHYARFRPGRSIAPGESVTVVGFPLRGLLTEVNVTNGIVSSLAGPGGDKTLVQMTAPVQAGNSGGPLLDGGGNVIGVVVAKLDALNIWQITGDLPQNINFAIRGEIAHNFVLPYLGTAPESSPASATKDTALIAKEAIRFTFPVECRP